MRWRTIAPSWRRRVLNTLILAALALAQTEPAGRRLFEMHCGHCHGRDGSGARGPSLATPRLARAGDDASLAQVILTGIPGTEMPPTRLTQSEGIAVIEYVKALRQRPTQKPLGNPARGEQLYRGKGGCARCHMIHGEGGRMGPDLTVVGLSRSPGYLRESIVAPEAALPERFAEYRLVIPMPDDFLMVRVITRDGREITGIRLNEDPFTIHLRDLEDRMHSFLKSELKEVRHERGKSPMPSYRTVFTPVELDDLVAYLSSLRSRQ